MAGADEAQAQGPAVETVRVGPDFAAVAVTVFLVAKKLWNAPSGTQEESDAAQELVAGLRALETMDH